MRRAGYAGLKSRIVGIGSFCCQTTEQAATVDPCSAQSIAFCDRAAMRNSKQPATEPGQASCLSWVRLGSGEPFAESPLHADERTSSDRADWSVLCQRRHGNERGRELRPVTFAVIVSGRTVSISRLQMRKAKYCTFFALDPLPRHTNTRNRGLPSTCLRMARHRSS